MKRYDRYAAIFLIALGLATAIYSSVALKLGTPRRPDAGFQTFLTGMGMAICSAVWLASRLGKDDKQSEPFWGKGQWLRPLLAVIFLVLYTMAMEGIGYILSTFVFMGAWQLFIERKKWLKASVITVASTACMYVLFVYLLGVPVPVGFLGQ